MRLAFLIIYCYAAFAETAFALAYGLAFRWRSTELGRQMLLYSATVAALMDLSVLAMWWRPPAWVFLTAFAVFAASLTWRLVILLRMWREQHQDQRRSRHRAEP